MEAQHEEADVLHEQRDEPEEDARADGDEGVAPHGQHVLLYAYLSKPRRMTDSAMNYQYMYFQLSLHVFEKVLRKSTASESDFSPCQVDDDGCEDESGEEHDCLEAAVPEEGARHAEHQVEAAYRRWKMGRI